MSKLQQILILLSMLYSQSGYVKTKDIAEALSLSERSVRRLIADLRELGYDIESQAGQDGGYRLETNNLFLPIRIEDRFRSSWLELRQYAEANPNFTDQQSILELLDILELQSQLDANIPYQVYQSKKLRPEIQTRINQNHKLLLEAIEKNQRVSLKYAQSRKGPVWQEFRPAQLQLFEGVYYVRGYYSDDLANERILRLSRIIDCKLLKKKMSSTHSTYHQHPFSQEIFREHRVVLHVSKQREDILEYEYGSDQRIVEYEDFFEVSFNKAGNQLIKELVLSFGQDVELIEPLELRQELEDELCAMIGKYK